MFRKRSFCATTVIFSSQGPDPVAVQSSKIWDAGRFPSPTPPDPIFFMFIQFSGKLGQIIGWQLPSWLASPSGKAWILQMIWRLVFQIETIGDAYCVAGGLHRAGRYHAQQIAWMALKMMGGANKEKAHDGNTLQVKYIYWKLFSLFSWGHWTFLGGHWYTCS